MPGHRYTQSEYALQRVVETFGNLLHAFEEHHLIHTYQVVVRYCQLEDIDNLVLQYLNSRLLLSEEFSEDQLFDKEA